MYKRQTQSDAFETFATKVTIFAMVGACLVLAITLIMLLPTM